MFLKNGFKDRDWIWATQNLDVELRGDFLLYNSDFAFFFKICARRFLMQEFILFWVLAFMISMIFDTNVEEGIWSQYALILVSD